MQVSKITMLAAILVAVAGCAEWDPYFVHQRDVCVDQWYGYWDQPCPPGPMVATDPSSSSPDELEAALRDIATLQKRIAFLEKQLTECEARSEGALERDLLKALQPEVSGGTVSVKQSGDMVTVNLASNLLFESGQAQLKAAGADALRRVGNILKDFPGRQVHVSGYTDNVPIRGALKKKFPTNQELSQARAASAAKALREGGVIGNLSVEGHGESNPVASNDTATGRAKNRRVEILVVK